MGYYARTHYLCQGHIKGKETYMSGYLKATGLTKIYGKREVVRNVSLEVARGQVVGLIGRNGAGKTTTFRMVIGLVQPNKGSIHFNGEDISQLPMYKRALLGLGYLPQLPTVFANLNVRENIEIILENLNLSRPERKKRLNALLEEMNLQGLAKEKASSLSGGERRRLEVTRTLSTKPSFMMWDEPFAAVDPKVVEELQRIIMELKEKNIGILITDHKPKELLSITDYAYLIEEGKIEVEGNSEDVANDPLAKELYLGDKFELSDTQQIALAKKPLVTMEDFMLLGKKRLKLGLHFDALGSFTNALAMKKNNSEAHFLRGQCFFEEKEYLSALVDFNKVKKISPFYEGIDEWLEKAQNKIQAA